MSEFINEFGKENFIIIIAVVIVIIMALIIIVLIERFQTNRRRKNQIKKELASYNNINNNINNNYTKPEPIITKSEPKKAPEPEEFLEPEPVQKAEEEIVYVEETNKEEVAKEKLEEVTKKLIEEKDDNNLIEHTNFETEQEEKSIISYDELVKASHDINEKNDLLLEDEGEEPITLEELYQKHVDDQNKLEEEKEDVKVNNPIFEDNGEKKFRNSEVISPVFGFYNGKVTDSTKSRTKKKEREEEAANMQDLEVEIQKTEEFLTELKRLKNKLD